jgi:hypothetical protein
MSNKQIRKAAGATNTNGLDTNATLANCPTVGAKNKLLANLTAYFALAGHAVIKGVSGDFTVCKYGMTRYCKDFAELQGFARQLGINHE